VKSFKARIYLQVSMTSKIALIFVPYLPKLVAIEHASNRKLWFELDAFLKELFSQCEERDCTCSSL
jgi:hypothetical protein